MVHLVLMGTSWPVGHNTDKQVGAEAWINLLPLPSTQLPSTEGCLSHCLGQVSRRN